MYLSYLRGKKICSRMEMNTKLIGKIKSLILISQISLPWQAGIKSMSFWSS